MPPGIPRIAFGPRPTWNPEQLRRHHERERRRRRAQLELVCSLPRRTFEVVRLAAFFGDRGQATHAFRAAPLDWGFWLTEPQATRGLARFLNADATGSRTRAFLTALGATDTATISQTNVKAEAPTRSGRIDLLIEWRDERGLRAAAVEAKFGAAVAVGQLADYRHHLRKIENPLLVLLTPCSREKDRKRRKQNRDWRPLSWRVLLLRFERALPTDDLDLEFARFRRTLWRQAH